MSLKNNYDYIVGFFKAGVCKNVAIYRMQLVLLSKIIAIKCEPC